MNITFSNEITFEELLDRKENARKPHNKAV